MTDIVERWDCGGQCIFGEPAGADRDCDECWANCLVSLSPACPEAQPASTDRDISAGKGASE